MKFDLTPIRLDFDARLTIVRQLQASTRLDGAGKPPAPGLPDVSRETRGLAIVLLYAAYEALLRATARGLLETAVRVRVGNRRLQPGFQVVAVFGHLQAIAAARKSRIWRGSGLDLVNAAFAGKPSTIDETRFPDIGTSFRRSQVHAVCQLYGLGDPAAVLREVWIGWTRLSFNATVSPTDWRRRHNLALDIRTVTSRSSSTFGRCDGGSS